MQVTSTIRMAHGTAPMTCCRCAWFPPPSALTVSHAASLSGAPFSRDSARPCDQDTKASALGSSLHPPFSYSQPSNLFVLSCLHQGREGAKAGVHPGYSNQEKTLGLVCASSLPKASRAFRLIKWFGHKPCHQREVASCRTPAPRLSCPRWVQPSSPYSALLPFRC